MKLCQLFVHDDFETGYDYTTNVLSPEAQLVKDCMTAWETSNPKGQIRPVLQTIFDSALFRGEDASLQKVKTPLEFVVSTVRALRSSTNGSGSHGTFTADTDGFAFATPMNRMGGMVLFDRGDPDGYPEEGPSWISAGTLAERLRFVQSFAIQLGQAGHTSTTNDALNSVSSPVNLIRSKLPTTSWTNAPAIADYFVSILYPGEGAANLTQYRDLAVTFLNTSDNGVSSPLHQLSQTGNPSPYDTRVRGAVGMLMTFQRFQEQ